MEPIIGQAIEIKLNSINCNWTNWPAVLTFKGINLIPVGKNRMLLGATLEEGLEPSDSNLRKLIEVDGEAPNWLQTASIANHWYGIRTRPINRPAPLLEKLEEGLILASAHYRNGILLAPATAEWIANNI